ncbi:hypothetical protein ACIBL3_35265 [Kribbella sp. NPDC050124]|uniref:hypothetical protein n=1 Tax=Kribbella sp. NPDC050124 TaxID=3364114 RepID=UPI00378ADE2C
MTSPWPTALLTALRRGQLLVAEVPAAMSDHRAWIAVYPLGHAAAGGFNVFHREFDRAYLDNGWCTGPDDGMIEVRTAHAADEADLTQLLTDWNVTPDELNYVHRSDYPV